MSPLNAWWRRAELDRTSFPELRDTVLRYEQQGATSEPRSYPGYPRWPLPRLRSRLQPGLDRTLLERHCTQHLDTTLPPSKTLGRLLGFAHGVHASPHRGPTPSAGGLQALEVYPVVLSPGWLPSGIYHYDRSGHSLSQLAPGADRADWLDLVPSLSLVEGGAVLWVLVGDQARAGAKYLERGARFLLLEAGHLMQNLCLLSASLGLATVPLGGSYERDIARALLLPGTDLVLYVGLCGAVS